MKKAEFLQVHDEIIMNKIYLIRDQKVMLDRDLAELYGVETRVLKQAVKRNLPKFPEDFMFELNEAELKNWRSQFVSSNAEKMGLRHKPYAFTEHGVLMISSVLHSPKAVEVNIQIMRIFTKTRQMLADNTEIRLIIEELRRKTENNTKNIEIVFQYLDELLDKQENAVPRQQIGYNTSPGL